MIELLEVVIPGVVAWADRDAQSDTDECSGKRPYLEVVRLPSDALGDCLGEHLDHLGNLGEHRAPAARAPVS